MAKLFRVYLHLLIASFIILVIMVGVARFISERTGVLIAVGQLPAQRLESESEVQLEESHVTTPMSRQPNAPSSQDYMGSNCWRNKTGGSLAIHMVVVPFLQFNTSREQINAREAEYKHVLQKNLAHPLVQCVHVLTTNYTETSIRFKDLSNKSKMLVSEVKSIDLTRDPFEYISQNLLGKDAMFANADIYLGEGFDRLDPTIMDKKKIVYALTRRVAPEDKCRDNRTYTDPKRTYTDTDKCLEVDYTRFHSHDVLLFRLHEPLPEEFLEKLAFDLVSPGIENVLIWLFKNMLHYCALNPCSILESFHYHCSNVRNQEGKRRVNNNGMSGVAPFTKSLDDC